MKETGFSRVSKNLIIEQIEKELKVSPTFFITQHTSVPAVSLDKLRAKLRTTSSRYVVVKNSLGRRALQKDKFSNLAELMTGACGIAFSSGDPVLSSKILMDFAKQNEGFKVQSGFIDGAVIGADQVKTLASLPTREALLGQVASVLQAPIRGLAVVLNASIRSLAVVLNAVSQKKEK